MKKTLVALVALAGILFAEDTKVTYTTTNAVGSESGGFQAKGFILDFQGSALTTTASPNGTAFNGLVQLDSISLNTGSAGSWAADGKFSLVITDTDFNIIGWSTTVSTADTESYKWSFVAGTNNEAVTLDTSKDYLVLADSMISFTAGNTLIKNNKVMRFSSTGVMDYETGKVDFDGSTEGSYSGLQFITVADPGDNNAYTSYTVGNTDAFNRYVPNVSIVTSKVIPEPATATLSLLALAGLCARRRR